MSSIAAILAVLAAQAAAVTARVPWQRGAPALASATPGHLRSSSETMNTLNALIQRAGLAPATPRRHWCDVSMMKCKKPCEADEDCAPLAHRAARTPVNPMA